MTPGPDTSRPAWFRRLAGYARRHRGLVVGAVAAASGTALLDAATPLLIRQVVDLALAEEEPTVWPWVAVLVVVALLQYAVSYARRTFSARLAFSLQHDLRLDLYSTLTRLDGAQQDRLDTGQVVSRSITDLAVVGGVLVIVPSAITAGLLVLFSLVAMAVLSPTLTLVTVAVLPALWWRSRRAQRALFPANWDAQQQVGALVGRVEAAVTGVRVVKGFGQEERELAELEQSGRRLFRSRMRAVRMQARFEPALQAVPALGQVAVLLLGGWLAIDGQITLGTFLAFSGYLLALVATTAFVAELVLVVPVARAGVERIDDLVRLTPAVRDAPDAVDLPAGPLGLRFDDVTFGHGDGDAVLRGVSFTVASGETVAVVGASGSGKSTLVQLLGRFYDPQSGTVEVGGTDLRRTRLTSARAGIAVVFEQSLLFADTVAANIAYGRPGASRADVEAAAQAAEADAFVRSLPQGYDTVVGEQGHTLSGGQRQRLALARALLTAPRVLVLDDATSAVDPRVEARINAGLRGAPVRTTLLVAHRRSTLALADRVVVLDGGRVVAAGTVAELERDSPAFRRLFSPAESAEPLTVGTTTAGTTAMDSAAVRRAVAVTSGGAQTFARDGGIAGAAAGDADLLARVAALPPATGSPDIGDDVARSADPSFGLRHLIRPVRGWLLVGLLLVALDSLGRLLLPALVRSGIDRGVAEGSVRALAVLSGLALVVVLATWALSRLALLVTGRTGERLLYLLRVKTFAHLQRLGLDYYEREPAGRIMTRMTTDVDALSNFLQTGLTDMVVSALTAGGVLVALVLLDLPLALVVIALLPLLVVATVVFQRSVVPVYAAARDAVGAVNATLQEDVAGLRVLQAYGRVEHNVGRFAQLSRAYREQRIRTQRRMAVYFPFVVLIGDLAGALVLGLGAGRLREGTLSAGELIAFLLYLGLFLVPVQRLSEVFDGYQQAAVGLTRLRELLAVPTGTPAASSPRPVGRLAGELVLADVDFRYAGTDVDVLHGLRLHVSAGESVALVGETGAGKSTVVKLVARFYDPTSGAVLVDGQDVRGLDLGSYRRRLGLVPQEPYLADGTVAEAIAYGRPDATRAEVVAAARAVGAHDALAALPGGYDHPVGERGHGLSAGQRQLVALARAELVDPDVLLLDEATAALDLAGEAVVARATAELTRKRTTLVVAHRLSTAARADRIVVLAAGRVVESGTHDELLGRRGTYAELWAAYADRTIENSPRPRA